MVKSRTRTVDTLKEEFVLLCEKKYWEDAGGRPVITADEVRTTLELDQKRYETLLAAADDLENRVVRTNYDGSFSLRPGCLAVAEAIRERRREQGRSRIARFFRWLYVSTIEGIVRGHQ
jgi:hypothetical protein